MNAIATIVPWLLIIASGAWLLAERVADAAQPGGMPPKVSRTVEVAAAVLLAWLVASDPSVRAALGVRLEWPAIHGWGFGGAWAMILASVAHARWLPHNADRRPDSRWFHAHNITVIPWLEEVVFRGALVFSPGGLVAAVLAHHAYNLYVAAGDWHRARTP